MDTIEHSAAANDVLAERNRQVSEEGWTPAHDDAHNRRELAQAAACYAYGEQIDTQTGCHLWPWSEHWWKPRSERENLVRAGALILAEIERLDRAST